MSDFIEFTARMRVPHAPIWGAAIDSTDGLQGVREILSGWVMRYIPSLETVLLGFDENIRLLEPTAEFLLEDAPFIPLLERNIRTEGPKEVVRTQSMPTVDASGFSIAFVEFRAFGWQPRIGHVISGTPTLATPSHISLLVHNLFNATIPRAHIPATAYEYSAEYAIPDAIQEKRRRAFEGLDALKLQLEREQNVAFAAEEPLVVEKVGVKPAPGSPEDAETPDDVETPAEVEAQESSDDEAEKSDSDADSDDEADTENGWWINTETHEPLGKDGRVQFNITGITVVNSMVSITGSLLEA